MKRINLKNKPLIKLVLRAVRHQSYMKSRKEGMLTTQDNTIYVGDAKSTPAYSSDLHFLGTKIVNVGLIMQLSVLSFKIRGLLLWGR